MIFWLPSGDRRHQRRTIPALGRSSWLMSQQDLVSLVHVSNPRPTRSTSNVGFILRCGLSLVWVGLVGTVGCDGTTVEPDPSVASAPTVRFLGEPPNSDTIEAGPRTFEIAVTDSTGGPAANRLVHVVEDLELPRPDHKFWFSDPNGDDLQGFRAHLTTDAAGRARFRMWHTRFAGTSQVRLILQPTTTTAFTATGDAFAEVSLEVLPGAPTRFIANDTVVYVGGTFNARGQFRDRVNNQFPGVSTVAETDVGEAVVVDGSGRGTGLAYGVALIGLESIVGIDTARVSVVPEGTLVGVHLRNFHKSRLIRFSLDGSQFDTLATTLLEPGFIGMGHPRWSPDGSELYYHDGFPRRIRKWSAIDGVGLPGNGLGADDQGAPEPSGDGRFIFFERGTATRADIYRVDVGVGFPERIWSGGLFNPTPSPDGSMVVLRRGFGRKPEEYSIIVLDVANQSTSVLGSSGIWPEWSPSGTRVGYIELTGPIGNSNLGRFVSDGGVIRLVDPNGANNRILGEDLSFTGLAWGPNEEWIAASSDGAGFWVVNLESGLAIPVPIAFGITDPDWRP